MDNKGDIESLFKTLSENIRYPFIVFDASANVIRFNKEASELFKFSEAVNFFDLLQNGSAGEFKKIIDSAVIHNTITTNADLLLRSGDELKLKMHLNTYRENKDLYLFCSFIQFEKKISVEGLSEIKLKTEQVKSLVTDKKILSVLDAIKSLFPFTYIGKEKVRKLINSIDGIFWIRDEEGNIVLANNNFAHALGLKVEVIEGKTEISFMPAYLLSFYHTIDQYIKSTLHWISTEGVSFYGLNQPDETIIQVPLINSGRSLAAVIGFSVKKINPENTEEIIEEYAEIINGFPYPAAVIGNDGIIKQVSSKLGELLAKPAGDLKNLKYNSVLPADICDKIQLFLEERFKTTKFDFFGRLNDEEEAYHTVQIQRGRKNLFIVIEKGLPEENLEQIINRRGIMFDILIQGNPQPVFIYDKENLRFLEVNDAALKLYGYRKDEFLQMDLTDLYTPEDIQSLLDAPADSKTAGKFTGPYKHKRKDGSIVYVELSKINFRYNDNDAHFNIVRDVTEKLDLQSKSQLFKAVFDNTEDLIFVTDASGFITFTNKAVQNELGYLKRELENTSFAALTKNEERGMVNTTVFQATPRDVIVLSIELKKADGTFLKTEITATPSVDYKNEINSFTILGKTQKVSPDYASNPPKEIIREIEVIREVPKEVIREVIVEKPVYVQSENDSPKENLQFLSSLFHDILTPINVIMGFVQELTESIQKPTAEQKESLDIINQNRDGLLNIMNSIVEYSSIEKDTIELNIREIPVTEIIENIHAEVDPIIKPRGIELGYGKISSSLKFKSDKQRMLTFLTLVVKMVSNISKEKKIYFSAVHRSENEFILSIRNNYGSSTNHLVENLSAIFLQDDSSTNKDFGIPKLTLRLARALLMKLKGRFELIAKADKNDYGFIFPMDYTSAPEIKTAPVHEVEPPVKEKPAAKKEEKPAKKEKKEIAPEPEIINSEIEDEPEVVEDSEKTDAEKHAEAIDRLEEYEDTLSNEELELESELSTIASEMSSTPEPEQKKEVSSEKIELSKLSCLYIEDQVDSQILFKVQMKELKETKFAVSFEEALPLLDNNHFDFIVIDINLQGEYNGIDAMKIIQKMPAYQNTPVIAVTAYVLPGDRENFIQTGFNDFISKPVFREKMINSLEKIFLMQV